MYYMVLAIINRLEMCPSVLDAWEELEVPGITILDSTGLGTMKASGIRDDIPLMPSLSDLFRSKEHRHRTIFTVVDSEELVDEIVATTERVIGNMDQPHNGVLFVLPVHRAVGLRGAKERAQQ